MFQAFSTLSFFSVWYWALMVAAWTLISHRTLGVPYDMILRAERLPETAGAVDSLAGIHIERIARIYRVMGLPFAATGGFFFAVLATLGFGSGIEIAQAVFLIAFPLALVGAANTRLALRLKRDGSGGADLRRALARRRFWNQVIGILTIFASAIAALFHHPQLLYY